MQQLRDLWTYLLALRPTDVIDILLVATLIYAMLYAVRGTRAVQLMRGVLLIILAVLLFRQIVQLTAFSWLVGALVTPLLISVPVIFQPELRRALERLGRAGILLNRPADVGATASMAQIVAQAASRLSEAHFGALMVLERDTGLDDLAERGSRLDAVATPDLLFQIFYPKTPFHDGAVLLRDGRVVAARVVIPLTDMGPEEGYGTRHLAALTITESTDAVAVVVSEETGTMSIARDGALQPCADETQLQRRLQRILTRPDTVAQGFWQPLQRVAGGGATLLAHPRRAIRRAWLDNLSSALLSLVLAVMVWLVSMADSRAMADETLFAGENQHIPISFVNIADGQAAFAPTARGVQVRVRGIQANLPSLTAADFDATADLSEADPSATTATADVQIDCRSCTRLGVRVADIQPVTVTVRLAASKVATYTVEAEAVAAGADGNYNVEAEFQPATVTLRAAGPELTRVAHVMASVPTMEDPLGETRFGDALAYPVDAEGKRIYEVSVDPPRVSGVLRYRRPIVELSVRVDYRGKLADGYVLDGWEVQPQWVRLDGPREVLQTMSFVSTQPVDYTGFTEDRAVPIKLKLPKDVRAVNAPDGVTVTMKIVAPGSRTFDVPVVAQNVKDALMATITPSQVRVLLSGTQSDLEKLVVGDVKAVVDLTGKGPGRHRVEIRIVPPAGVQKRSVTPEEVDVELRAAEPETKPTLPRPTPLRAP